MTSNDRTPSNPLLLVDDEKEALDSAEATLLANGVDHFIRCQDGRDVANILASRTVDAVMLDLVMPHLRGEEVLQMITREYPGIPVIMVTGMGDVDKAVECMRLGAFDYLVKPVEPARMATSVRRAIEMRALTSENERLRSRFFASTLEHPEAFADIVARSPAMLTIFRYVEVVAASPQCVAITGETGVGKELVARVIHGLSGRKGKMVSVNVAGLDDHMFADTLFGHRRGAFTGADENRAGLVEKAEGGTLFLDEIGDLTPVSQVKLLRLLQEREYFRLGEDEPRVTNARVVVATSRELKALQAEGKFRKDLFYRLMTHHIQLPPLRERLDEDLAILVDHFLGKAAEQLQKRKPVAPPELIALLRTYDFPGNVRELESMIFDAVSRHQAGVLSLGAIREHVRGRHVSVGSVVESAVSSQVTIIFPKPLPTLRQTVELLIHEALTIASHNQKLAAGMLGITPQALGQRLKRRQESDEMRDGQMMSDER